MDGRGLLINLIFIVHVEYEFISIKRVCRQKIQKIKIKEEEEGEEHRKKERKKEQRQASVNTKSPDKYDKIKLMPSLHHQPRIYPTNKWSTKSKRGYTETQHIYSDQGTRCRSVVRAFAHGAMGRRIDPSWWTH